MVTAAERRHAGALLADDESLRLWWRTTTCPVVEGTDRLLTEGDGNDYLFWVAKENELPVGDAAIIFCWMVRVVTNTYWGGEKGHLCVRQGQRSTIA